MYTILEGEVTVFNKFQNIIDLPFGEVFGEFCLFNDTIR